MPIHLPNPARFRTARARLLVLVMLVILPALGVQVYGALSDLQQILAERKLESGRDIQQARSTFDALISETRTVFTELVRSNDMRSPNNCTQVFTALRFAFERLAPEALNLGLADVDGNIYCAVNPVLGEKNIGGQADFQAALESLDMSLGVYTANPAVGPAVVSVSYPVLSFDGSVQTVIFAILETRWLQRWQDGASLPDGAALTLLAPDGDVLWRSVDQQVVDLRGKSGSQVAWFTVLQAGESAYESADFDGVVRLNTMTVLRWNNQIAGYLHLGYPVAELYAQVYHNLYWRLWLLGLILCVGLGLAWWCSEVLFLTPLKNLLEVVERVQTGDLNARVAALDGLGELTELAQSFDQMTDALQRREAERKQLEERFRVAFESSAIGMGLLTLDGWIMAVNAAGCEISGYTEEELTQRNDRQNAYPEDVDVGMDLFAEMLAGKRGYYSVEKRYVRKNGEIFWTRLTLSLVRSDDGQPAYLIGMFENIDEVKRKSAALTESELRFRTLFDTAAVGIGILGLDRKVIDVNPALCQMYGRTRAELVGQTSALVTHPDDVPRAIQQHQDLMAGKFDRYFDERRYIRKNGELFWANISMSLVRDDHGSPLYIVGMVTNIHEQKKAQDNLRESEARFKAMFNNAAVGMAMMSLDRRVISVNEASARITGYTVEELINTDPGRLSHSEDAEVGVDPFSDLVAGKIAQFQMEKRFVRKNGEVYWGRVSYSAVPGKDGLPEYLVGLIEDITDEKEARRTLAESEARFRTLYDSAEMGIVLVDLGSDGNLPLDEARFNHLVANQRLNPAMLHMFGYTTEEMQNIAISSLIYSEDRGIDAQQFHQLLTGEIDCYRIEKRFVRKDGSVFWGRLTDSLARTAEGAPRMVIGIIEDINEERQAKERLAAQEADHRHQLERRIAERTEELNLANERLREKAAQDAVLAERTRLARDLHDAVTQTLFSTTLIADVLPELWEMNNAEGRRRLEELRLLTRGALAEMRTLLVELRPNALVEVPLPTLLRQLVDALAGRARINIQLSAEGEAAGGRRLPPDVQVGFYRIAQEALNNVVKHAKASEAVITLRMGETVRLTVADNGKGFDPSIVTADHLGLKIMRERAEAIGAKFSMYSEPDEGTQISVVWQEPSPAAEHSAPSIEGSGENA